MDKEKKFFSPPTQRKSPYLFEFQKLPSTASPEMMVSSFFGINPGDNVLFIEENTKEREKEDNLFTDY